MKLQKDDVRLMQFVLNEISNIDRDIVAQAIVNQPEIAAEVESLKTLIAPVQDALSQPNNLQLTAAQKQNLFAKTIHSQAHVKAKIGFLAQWQWLIGGLTAVAFTVLVFNKSMYKEAQNVQHADISPKELYAPTELSETATTGAAAVAPKGGTNAAKAEMKSASRDAEKKKIVESAPPPTAAPVLVQGAARPESKYEDVAARAREMLGESEIVSEQRAAPAKKVTIPTHASDESAMEKDAAPQATRKMLQASKQAVNGNTTGQVSAFGSGGQNAQEGGLGKADSKTAAVQIKSEIEITAPSVKNLKIDETLRNTVMKYARACLTDELSRTTLILINYFPKDQKIRIYLTTKTNTIAHMNVDQQKCLITELSKLPWSDATQVDIAIRNVSK